MPKPNLSPTDERAILRLFSAADECLAESKHDFNLITLPMVSLFSRLREEHGLAGLLCLIREVERKTK